MNRSENTSRVLKGQRSDRGQRSATKPLNGFDISNNPGATGRIESRNREDRGLLAFSIISHKRHRLLKEELAFLKFFDDRVFAVANNSDTFGA